MKKYLCMLGVLLFIFVIGVANVNAADVPDTYIHENCVKNGLGGKTCTPVLVVNRTITISELKIDLMMSKLELIRENPIKLNSGWTEIAQRTSAADAYVDANGVKYDVVSLRIANTKKTLEPATYVLGEFITEQKAGVNLEDCKLMFVVSANFSFPSCTIITENGTTKYYDKTGNSVTESEYFKACYKCLIETDANGNVTGYRGSDGRLLSDDATATASQKWTAQCADVPLSCRWVLSPDGNSITYYGKDERILANQKEFIKECYDNSCEALLIDEKVYFFDRNNNYTDEAGYYKSCYPCQYYKNTEEDARASEEALYRPLYTGFIDAEGNKTNELGYLKSCHKFSCEVLSDGTHYDKDGNVVSEEDYLKSCFKCRKEDGKFYDENGKETTEDNWKVMCEPHKCQYLGGKYFNDKGAIVTKAEYDKACTNPKTGDKETTTMYLYIFGGFALTVAIILGSRKFAKISKVK